MTTSTKTLPVWIRAARPKTLTAALVPVIAGAALAVGGQHPLDWTLLICGLISALFIQTGTNLINDAYDDRNGADREDRLGPVRLIQSGILTQRQVYYLGLSSFVAAIVVGLPLIIQGGLIIALFFALAAVFGYCYTGGPIPLAYVGLGDIAVIAFFGVIETTAVYYLLTGEWSQAAFVAGLQIGMLATALLAVNNLRDIDSDTRAHKKTLAVRFGKLFGRIEVAAMVLLPYILGIYWLFHDNFFAFALPLLAFPIAVVIVRKVFQEEPSAKYNKYLGMAGLHHLVFGALLSLGWLIV